MFRLFMACFFAGVLAIASAAIAAGNFTVLGQELGVSTYAQAKKDLASRSTLSEGGVDRIAGGKILNAISKGGAFSEAIFAYDSENRLAAVTVRGTKEQVKSLLTNLTKGLKVKDGTYTNGKGFVGLEGSESPVLVVATDAFYKKSRIAKGQGDSTLSIVWAISLAVGIAAWFVAVRLRERVWRDRSGWTKEGLLHLAMSLDLPGHDEITKAMRQLSRFSELLVPLASTLGWHVLMVATDTDPQMIAVAVPTILLFGILMPAILELANGVYRNTDTIIGACVMIGGIGGIIFALVEHTSLLMLVFYALVGAFGTVIAALIAKFAGTLVFGVAMLVAFAGYPLSWPILKIMMARITSMMRKHGWTNSAGRPIVTLSTEGVSGVNTEEMKIFVPDPCLRRNGAAKAYGIPKFTFADFCDQAKVKTEMANHAIALADLAKTDERFNAPEFKWASVTAMGAGMTAVALVNPTSGLPMIDNIPGGMDVGGNVWGQQDINPASGLPTMAGPGSIDVGGNNYGLNDAFDHNPM